MSRLGVLSCFVRFLVKETQKSVLTMARNDSQIDKPQLGRPKRAELPGVNIITGVQNIVMNLIKCFCY